MNILIVTSSAQGEASVSNRLAEHVALEARSAHPGGRIVVRDVGRHPLPHLTEDTVAGVRAEAASAAEIAARDLSAELIAEVQNAELVVIASPMYNFGISSTLKTWFDYVLRPRVTFQYSEKGPEGLLGGRKAVVIESRAGFYPAGDPADSQEPHLKQMLSFVGITDVTFVRAEKLAFGPEAAAASIAAATEQLTRIVRAELPLAA